uniref:KIB1-4 beta-propeller domain-containing protein n=1 Tax=Ananas comosus var. bracteatus TaxID=296719 RepID=A0A6V7PIC4_ANACO|nr:unnamed protein product [Ananas comosus var. bracteatus]
MESRHPKRRRVASRSWSHLVTDILIDVASKHVTSAATYTTLRGVCRSWRAALPATVPRPHRLPPQLPFLYIFAHSPHNPAGQAFSLTTNRTFALRHLADAHESASVGSGYGWLLLLDPCATSSSATLSQATRSSGDNFWTVHEHPEFFVDDIIFYEDRRCIAIGVNGACAVFDFATADGGNGFFTEVPNLPASGSPFLVESAGNIADEITAVSESGDLGGRILFLKQCNSMSVASMHFPGFEGDSIYFPKINRPSLTSSRSYYTATIWKCQFKNGIARRFSVKCECAVYPLWPKVWWLPPNLHEKLGLLLTTNRNFAIRHLADAHRSVSVGSGYGWLLLLDPMCNLILRNPFTGDTIRLPSLDGTVALNYKGNLPPDHYFLVHRAILSSDPSADRNFLVVLFSSASVSRCFTWRSGDNFWTVHEHPAFFVDDIIFYEDRRCIAVGFNGACAVFDFATADGGNGFFTEVPNLPVSGSPFLVESAGHVWLVTVMMSIIPRKEAKVEIYRLDLSRLRDKVTAVSERGDLGGRILFLQQCNSMSVASTHFPGFEGDSIYFTEIKRLSLTSRRDNTTAAIWKCQFKNGITRRCSVEGECGGHSLWPKLWWVPPNLHKKLGE